MSLDPVGQDPGFNRTQIDRERWNEECQRERATQNQRVTALQRIAIGLLVGLNRLGIRIREALGWHRFINFLKHQQHQANKLTKKFIELFGAQQHEGPLPEGPADGTGGYAMAMLLSYENQEVIRKALPSYLELCPSGDGGQEGHPLVITLGVQRKVRPVWQKPWGMNYNEVIIAIPDVQLKEEYGEPRGPFMYIPALRLDQLTPAFIGWLYGYRKRWSRVDTPGLSFQVATLLAGRKLFGSQVNVGEELGTAAGLPHLQPWLDRLEDQPIISQRWPFGKLLCTHFHWEWALAPVRTASVELAVQGDSIPGLESGRHSYQGTADRPAPGARLAYVMSVPWRLLMPFPRSDYKPLPKRVYGSQPAPGKETSAAAAAAQYWNASG